MINALPKLSRDWQPDFRHFSISSKWLYEEDSRFDATTYAKGAFDILDELEACVYPKATVGELCGTIWHPVQNQARSNFKRIYTKPENGVPFVGSRNMFSFPLRPERYLSKRMEKLNDLMVPEGWLLVSRSGTVGNILFVNNSLTQCAISDHTIRVEPVKIPAGYLYTFLSSRYGQPLLAKGIYGSTVDELEPKHIAGIPVPLVPESEKQAIHEKIIRAYALRDEANELFRKADTDLHTLLGVSPFTEDDVEYLSKMSSPRAFVVSSAELGIRLDATNHVPLSCSAVHKLQSCQFPLITLKESVKQIYLAHRFARIYVEKNYGTPLLQGRQLPLMRINDLKYISNKQTIRMDRWIIRENWVLVTCSGTIGRIAVSTAKQDRWAASQHILRIIPETNVTHPGFIATFLSTPFGQHQLKAKIYGGVVDELTAEDTASIFIPDVPYSMQEEIGNLVLKAYQMRDEANDIEDRAISNFENLISRR